MKLEGFRRPMRIHSQANTGASVMTNNELNDWNQLEGNSRPKAW